MLFKKIKLLSSTLFITLLTNNGVAAPVNLTGSWTGTGVGQQVSCKDPSQNQNFSNEVNFSFNPINEQLNIIDPSQFNLNFTHSVPLGNISVLGVGSFENNQINFSSSDLLGTSSRGETAIYTLNAEVINDRFNFSGQGVLGDCQYNYNGLAIRDIELIFLNNNPLDPDNMSGTLVTNNKVTLTRAIVHTNEIINNRIKNLLQLNARIKSVTQLNQVNQQGLSAGDGDSGFSVWNSIDYNDFENTFSQARYNGSTKNLLFGIDYSLTDTLLAGVALGYERAQIDTDFNLGKMTSKGFSFSPYLGFALTETWSGDLTLSYSRLKHDQYRIQNNQRINSDVDTVRWFISANINGSWQFNQLALNVYTGIIHAENNDEHFKESNGNQVAQQKSKVTTVNLGSEIAYSFMTLEPFLGLTYNYDTNQTSNQLTNNTQLDEDRDNFMLLTGVRYFAESGLSVNAELSKRLSRKYAKETNFTISVLWQF
jgi:hypothetical protein